METKLNIRQKLLKCIVELKAPKNQYNSFGKYSYRSCEDVLEGLKPLLDKYGCFVLLNDSIELIGDRYYVKATACFIDVETGEEITSSAYAREALTKKGMDDAQVTGATSSYSRKYALNGLFCIDDTKDADTRDNRASNNQSKQQTKNYQNKQQASKPKANEKGANKPNDKPKPKRALTVSTETVKEYKEKLKPIFNKMDSSKEDIILGYYEVVSFDTLKDADVQHLHDVWKKQNLIK